MVGLKLPTKLQWKKQPSTNHGLLKSTNWKKQDSKQTELYQQLCRLWLLF